MPRLDAEMLANMSDDDYKKLSPEDLARVNQTLPKQDYEKPYRAEEHPFPRVLYSLVDMPGGGQKLRSATVPDARREKELCSEGDWRRKISDWNIETHPGAPDVVIEEYAVEFKPGEEAKVVAAGQ
jgi:hypothetical protein